MYKYKMAADDTLYVRVLSWNTVGGVDEAVEIYGYTSNGSTIYVRIPRRSTFIVKFNHVVTDDTIRNIKDFMNPKSIHVSTHDAHVAIIRGAELLPIELSEQSEDLVTWTDPKQDPNGWVESLLQARDINPYSWLKINNYFPISGSHMDLNIQVEEEHISDGPELQDIPERLLFWDIETFSSIPDEFPSSLNVGDFIFMISIITVLGSDINGYVIVNANADTDTVSDSGRIIIRTHSEKELLERFLDIFRSFKPSRQIHYNGSSFDIPYLIDRLNIHGMEFPEIFGSKTSTSIRTYITPFGKEDAKSLTIPGVETIDLIQYFRLFYPWLSNHKLDTIAKTFIGEGKTGLSIDEMMAAVRTGVGISKVIDYSYIDSLRMYQLWNDNDINIMYYIELVCNNLRIRFDTLLTLSLEEIIDRAIYNIDPGIMIKSVRSGVPEHVKDAQRGIYRSVYIYDYSELYRIIMMNSDQRVISELALRLSGHHLSL